MRRVIPILLFASVIFSVVTLTVHSRKHRELPTRKVRHHEEETMASTLKSTKSPKKNNLLQSSKSPKKKNLLQSSKSPKKKNLLQSSKSPQKKQGPQKMKSSKNPLKYDVHQRSTKAPVMFHQVDHGAHNKDPLPFMYKHAESLEDLYAILMLSPSIDKEKSELVASNVSSPMPLDSVNASLFECIDNHEFLTIDGFDCRWIDAEDIRRQEYCSDASVQSNCPRVCGKCCQDDVDFSYEFTKDCEWLRNPTTDPSSVERQCAKQVVQTACPSACGICGINDANCTDDSLFIIKTEVKDCAWLSTVSIERKEKVCKRLLVQDACQVTCNMCRPNVSTHPSFEPSFGPSTHPSSIVTNFQETDSIPSYQPSSNPTSSSAQPSDPDCEFPPRDPISDVKPCVDDPTYITPFGGDCGCELFQGTDCNAWGALLDDQQLQEIWKRCPVSCGVNCQNLDMACIDDETYKSPANSKFGCEIYDGNCMTLWVSFLTSEEIDEALKRCPVSCGVPCTSTPSSYPTFDPSGLPSKRLISAVPSHTPSFYGLTSSPSTEHSDDPSINPSHLPSDYATSSPSLWSSSKPSVLPTFHPSMKTTMHPSSRPSRFPSEKPSDKPSSFVSILPSISNSVHPTAQYSVHPSIIPTQVSSDVPTIDPTVQPSSSPTIHKSESPSHAPTVLPSTQRSVHPSIIPTQASSNVPTIDPTVQPSSSPTIHKSESPSHAPTVLPSTQRSVHPSIIPTQASSDVPTIAVTTSTRPTQCIDDSEYRSPINPRFGCELYCGTDCFQWGSLLNFTQLQEIFLRCPDSCKVPCGYTLPQSYMTPSSTPTISNIPTKQPSQVSNLPSNEVTTSPTSATSKEVNLSPSSHPSNANPSSYPSTQVTPLKSNHPSYVFTSRPSVNNTAAPSFVQSTNWPTIFPTTHPSVYPSMSPTTRCGIPDDERIATIFEILQNVTDLSLLLNPGTSQGKAMNWLIYEDKAHLCPNEVYECENRIIQRYALAVIYFATGGDSWSKCSRDDLQCGTEIPFINAKNFLSDSHECIWAGIGCMDSKCVRVINFEKNNMEGTIPDEISSLIHLEYWAMEQGRLQSTIPSTISSLTKLFFLDLDFNLFFPTQ